MWTILVRSRRVFEKHGETGTFLIRETGTLLIQQARFSKFRENRHVSGTRARAREHHVALFLVSEKVLEGHVVESRAFRVSKFERCAGPNRDMMWTILVRVRRVFEKHGETGTFLIQQARFSKLRETCQLRETGMFLEHARESERASCRSLSAVGPTSSYQRVDNPPIPRSLVRARTA